MKIEVVAKTTYTVHLTDEDVEKVKEWISQKTSENDLPSFNMEYNIRAAIYDLQSKGEISLYDDGKCTETDFSTESIEWSEFEEKEPEDILNE